MKDGQQFPMSTMPGEWVDNVFAGGMGPETIHFLEACIRDTPVMVTPESARRVMETYSAADLVGRPRRADRSAADQRDDFGHRRAQGEKPGRHQPGGSGGVMKKSAKGVGLAIVGGGRVGLFRGEVAARHPAVEWIGLAEKNPNRAGEVAPKISADFVTQSHVELLKRPEVTAAIICTDEHLHVDPIMVALERGIPLLIEKPLATRLDELAAY